MLSRLILGTPVVRTISPLPPIPHHLVLVQISTNTQRIRVINMERLLLLLHIYFTVHTVSAYRNELSSQPPLRCCYMEEPPISFQNRHNYWNNGLDGVIRDHLLQLQAYLNWTCSTIQPYHQAGENGFNTFVTSMHQCTNISTGQIIDSPQCECEVGIGGWFQTSSRFGLVDFLPPFAYDRYVVFARVSEATVSGKVWFFIQTFDCKAWICIMALFVMFTFLKILDNRFAVPAPYEPLPNTYSRFRRYGHYLTKSGLLFRLRKATQSTMMRMLMITDETVVENGNTTRQWFFNLIVAVVALFLVLSYEASMTASLVQESVATKYETVTDLLNCHVLPSEICILRGGALETYWENSIAMDSDCHIRNPPHLFDSYQSLYQAVRDGPCKYGVVIESAITSAIRERYCGDFVIVGEPIIGGGLSMLLPKGSNLTETMSLATLELLGNQTTTNVMHYFNNLPQCKAEVNTSLSFNKLRVFFIIAYSVGGALFLAMVFIPQPNLKGAGSREEFAAHERPEEMSSRLKTLSSSSSEDSRDESIV